MHENLNEYRKTYGMVLGDKMTIAVTPEHKKFIRDRRIKASMVLYEVLYELSRKYDLDAEKHAQAKMLSRTNFAMVRKLEKDIAGISAKIDNVPAYVNGTKRKLKTLTSENIDEFLFKQSELAKLLEMDLEDQEKARKEGATGAFG